MNFFSIISIVACVLYLQIGCYVLQLERKSRINQLFLILCISLAIWSFAFAFVYVTNEAESIWMEISALGWCTFSSIALHLVLLFTGNKACRSRSAILFLYLPSILFFYIAVCLFWKDHVPSRPVQIFFYVGDFIYHVTFLCMGILLIALWGARSNQLRKKKQARILVWTSLTPFLLNLATQYIIPDVGSVRYLPMGHLYCLIMIMGAYYAIIKYGLFAISPKLYVNEVLQEMMDLVIVASADGTIIKMNKGAEKLLGYTKEQLYGRRLESILQKEVVSNIFKHKKNTDIYRLWEVYFLKKNNSRLPVNITCSFMVDEKIGDTLGLVVVGHDISLLKKLKQEVKDHKEAKEKIQYMAEHDSLTGLASRKYFYQVLHDAVARSMTSGEKFAVLFLDLDDLKQMNDTYGHEAGDELLCLVGERIKNVIDRRGLAARIGGDEFTFLLYPVADMDEAKEIAGRIQTEVNRPACIGGRMVNVNSSMGISVFPEDGRNGSELVKKADMEMYLVKSKKKAG